MTAQSLDPQRLLGEVAERFAEAEVAIKEVEDTGSELIVPAVNQLRYTGNHLIRYLNDPSDIDSLTDAVKHCKRATYDAYEAAILNQLMEYRKFKDDYRNVIVADIVSDYSELARQIEEARKFARDNNQSKTRGDYYMAGRDHLKTITTNVAKLSACRDELNKKIRQERRNTLLAIIGAVGTLIALIAYFRPTC